MFLNENNIFVFGFFFQVEREKKKERQQNLIDVSKEFAINSEANEKDTENGSLLTSSPNKLTNNPDSFVWMWFQIWESSK